MRNFLLFFFLLIAGSTFGQSTFSISGTIKDQKETLPGVGVYLAGYKMATVTNNEGKFVLTNLLPGSYDLLIQMIGYFPVSKNVIITDKSVNIEIVLKENTTLLKEVVIKPDPNRLFYLNLFREYFIGRSPNSVQCKIINSNVLNFNDDTKNRILTARASDLLVIENQALGYRVKYLLEDFEYNYKTKIIYYAGHPTFEELKGNNAKQKKWTKNRSVAFNGSIQHFYKALYENKITAEGFAIHKLSVIPNPAKKPDSLINANIKRLTQGQSGMINLITYNGGNDSLSYWLKQRSVPEEINLLNRANVNVDTLVKAYANELKMMNFKDQLYIVYNKEKEGAAFNMTNLKQSRPPEIGDSQVSVVTMLKSPVVFSSAGAIFDTRTLLYSGYWSYEKVADLLPLDYLSNFTKAP